MAGGPLPISWRHWSPGSPSRTLGDWFWSCRAARKGSTEIKKAISLKCCGEAGCRSLRPRRCAGWCCSACVNAPQRYDLRAGEAFAVAQGGIYASPRVAEVVAFIRKLGVRGVGQSSWGPTVFAIVENTERAEQLAQRVRAQFGLSNDEVVVTAARNQGAIFEDAEPQAATRQPG